jgi:hypothetical protein
MSFLEVRPIARKQSACCADASIVIVMVANPKTIRVHVFKAIYDDCWFCHHVGLHSFKEGLFERYIRADIQKEESGYSPLCTLCMADTRFRSDSPRLHAPENTLYIAHNREEYYRSAYG